MNVTGLAEAVISGPLLAPVLYAAAFVTATVLVRWVPRISKTTAFVTATRLTPIDGLRAFLGLGVFIHHTAMTWFFINGQPWQVPPSRIVVHLGETGVSLFFMITSFLFWSRVVARGANMSWSEFFVARLYRLYPGYLLALGLMVAAVLWTTAQRSPFTVSPLFGPLLDWLGFTMFLTPDLGHFADTQIIVAKVVWSLRYEWLFYIALPLLAFLFSRARSIAALSGSLGALLIIYWGFGWAVHFRGAILQMFLGGIVAVYWRRNSMLARWSRGPVAGGIALAVLALVMLLVPTAYASRAAIALTLFFCVIASGNDLWGVLRWPGVLWLGDVTYSVYLLHGLLLWLVFQKMMPLNLATDPRIYLAVALAVSAALVVAASVSFLAVERPGIALGKRHYHLARQMVPFLRGRLETRTSGTA